MHGESDFWEAMRTARAIRRYRDEPVDPAVWRRCIDAATWAPSGGNQQPWRFVALSAPEVRAIIGKGAQKTWELIVQMYRVTPPDEDDRSSKARVVRAMYEHMMGAATVPVCILFCMHPQGGATDFEQGASIFPAMQNFLLAARAQGLGAAVTLWHRMVEEELRAAVAIPDDWWIGATVTAGWPAGHHGPVSRTPAQKVLRIDHWENAVD